MNIKLTENRKAVLQLLQNIHHPVSAYDILDALRQHDSKWQPPTVYRALDYLKEAGLIHKIESQQKYICCDHGDQPHPMEFMLCESCGAVTELSDDIELRNRISALTEQSGFLLKASYLECHGLCRRCRN